MITIDPNRTVRVDLGEDRELKFKLRRILAPPGKKLSLKKGYDPGYTGGFKDKPAAQEKVAENIGRLQELQEKLYAQDTFAILIILQALDAAGKDGVIKHVMSGVNPQGCHVTSFKAPSPEELDHDYLWRAARALPQRGMIGIFNRSYYEEVLVVRVHPELLKHQKLPLQTRGKDIWERRFNQINNFEKYLVENGILLLKFFLNVSKEEQCKRFIERIEQPEKNWKFSAGDFQERQYWNDYQKAYEDCFSNTSTPWAPWFIIPADHKWFTRLAVSEVIVRFLDRMDLKFPEVSKEHRAQLQEARKKLVEKM
jgi:PPK2 family polyphosphate:nucleotide phosphotransferase